MGRIGLWLNVFAIVVTTLYVYYVLPETYNYLPMPGRRPQSPCNATGNETGNATRGYWE